MFLNDELLIINKGYYCEQPYEEKLVCHILTPTLAIESTFSFLLMNDVNMNKIPLASCKPDIQDL